MAAAPVFSLGNRTEEVQAVHEEYHDLPEARRAYQGPLQPRRLEGEVGPEVPTEEQQGHREAEEHHQPTDAGQRYDAQDRDRDRRRQGVPTHAYHLLEVNVVDLLAREEDRRARNDGNRQKAPVDHHSGEADEPVVSLEVRMVPDLDEPCEVPCRGQKEHGRRRDPERAVEVRPHLEVLRGSSAGLGRVGEQDEPEALHDVVGAHVEEPLHVRQHPRHDAWDLGAELPGGGRHGGAARRAGPVAHEAEAAAGAADVPRADLAAGRRGERDHLAVRRVCPGPADGHHLGLAHRHQADILLGPVLPRRGFEVGGGGLVLEHLGRAAVGKQGVAHRSVPLRRVRDRVVEVLLALVGRVPGPVRRQHLHRG
mmetsp:Transcript_8328/g.23433  ORF Transcript_8328/g.23433 Transcript_8328/m.23433 type:complete len:367 (-) Transcript_8328:71-1171(-)